MPSQFYLKHFERRFPFTPLLLERLAQLRHEGAEPSFAVLAQTLVDCGLLTDVTEADLEYFEQRFNELEARALGSASSEESGEEMPRPKPKGAFGAKFMTWLSDLSMEQTCLLLAEGDAERAYALYTRADIDEIAAAADLRVQYEWHRAACGFEAVILGMGGELSGADPSQAADAVEVDFTKQDDSGLKSLVSALQL